MTGSIKLVTSLSANLSMPLSPGQGSRIADMVSVAECGRASEFRQKSSLPAPG